MSAPIHQSFKLYYNPKGESPLNLKLMRLIDEQFLITPFYGFRQMARHLRRQGYCIGRHPIRRLMRIMDWYSRKVLSWRLSNSMEVSFCLEALEEAFARHGQQARQDIGSWISFYNQSRPHSTFDGRTPEEVYNQNQSQGHDPDLRKKAA